MLAAHETAEHLHAPGRALLALGRRLDIKRVDLGKLDDGDFRQEQREIFLPVRQRFCRMAENSHHLRQSRVARGDGRVLLRAPEPVDQGFARLPLCVIPQALQCSILQHRGK